MLTDADGGDDERSMRLRTRGAGRAPAVRLLRLRDDVLPSLRHSPGIGDLLPRLRGVAAGHGGRARGRAVRAPLRLARRQGRTTMTTACHRRTPPQQDRPTPSADFGTPV